MAEIRLTTRSANNEPNVDKRVGKAKFHYGIWFEAGSKLVADLQQAEIWPIISLLAAN